MFKTKKEQPVANPDQNALHQRRCGPHRGGQPPPVAVVGRAQRRFSPPGRPPARLSAPQEVVEVSVIAELRRKGFSLQKIRRVLRFLQKEMGKRLGEALAERQRNASDHRRQEHLPRRRAGRIIDVLKNAKQPMFLVCVTDQLRRFQASAARKPAKSEGAPAGTSRSRAG